MKCYNLEETQTIFHGDTNDRVLNAKTPIGFQTTHVDHTDAVYMIIHRDMKQSNDTITLQRLCTRSATSKTVMKLIGLLVSVRCNTAAILCRG